MAENTGERGSAQATRSPTQEASTQTVGERAAKEEMASSQSAHHGASRRTWRDRAVIFGFMLPALAVYSLYVLWPIINGFYFSTLDWNGISEPIQIGFENFITLATDPNAWAALWHTLILVASSLAFQLPIGLALALLLLVPLRGIKVFRTIYFLPLLMSTVAIGILWSFIYNPTFGAVNRALGWVGLESLQQGWLGEAEWALPSLVVVICWQFIPFYMILYRAGLTSIPGEVNEAAVVDGATYWSRFRHVTLPMLSGTTRTAVLLSVIGALKYFDLIWIMTGGGPGNSTEVLATYMYSEAFSRSNLGYGSAIAVVLFVFALIVTSIVLSQTRRGEE